MSAQQNVHTQPVISLPNTAQKIDQQIIIPIQQIAGLLTQLPRDDLSDEELVDLLESLEDIKAGRYTVVDPQLDESQYIRKLLE
ncbi:MAG: hypothetical protein QW453_06890 [Thermoprotei archaeon]